MKKILTSIRAKCPIMIKSPADKIYSAALKVLNNLTKQKQRRLRYMGNKFIKRFSFSLRVFKKLVDKRLDILRKVELKRKKAEAKKKGKGKGKGKGKKKKFFLEMSSSLMSGNVNANANVNANGTDKKKKKGKKGKKCKKGKKGKKCRKGKKVVKNSLGIKLPKNNAYDKKFIRETNLTPEKAIFLAKFVVRAISKINRV